MASDTKDITGIIDYPSGGIWAGTFGEQKYGDDLANQTTRLPKRNLFPNAPRVDKQGRKIVLTTNFGYPVAAETAQNTQIRNNLATKGDLEKILGNAVNSINNSNGASVTQTAQNATGAISDFVANNKWLVIGGAAVVGYFLFVGGSGGGLLEKSVITRYGKK